MGELLDTVNENDEVIGQIDRDDPEKYRHIFRMVFVGFYTPEKHIILQKRSLLKKSSPGLLTATASGHVSSGQTYDEAAVREAFEETGIAIDEAKLKRLGTVFGGDAMRTVYAYPFNGHSDDLVIEKDEGDGFVEMSIPDLREQRLAHPERFAPFLAGDASTVLLDYIEQA